VNFELFMPDPLLGPDPSISWTSYRGAQHDLKADERASPAIVTLRGGLSNLRIYIEQNRGWIAGCGARYREGKRIAAAAAEARVNDLAARRMAEKRQMRWPERGANPLLQVRTALANGNLADCLAYQRRSNQGRPSFRLSGRSRSFGVPHDPRQLNRPTCCGPLPPPGTQRGGLRRPPPAVGPAAAYRWVIAYCITLKM
jgi:hypothetical protein